MIVSTLFAITLSHCMNVYCISLALDDKEGQSCVDQFPAQEFHHYY